jgi:prolyl-tRNA synthetase
VSLCREEKDIAAVEELYNMMIQNGVEVLYDDRDGVRAGEKFADSDLIGIPVRIVVSPKTLEKLSVEVKKRNETEAIFVELGNLQTYLKSLI